MFTSSIVPLESTSTGSPELAARRGARFIESSDVRQSNKLQIEKLLHVYSRYGGVMNADQYASVLGEHQSQPISQLARMGGRAVVQETHHGFDGLMPIELAIADDPVICHAARADLACPS